MTLRPNDKKILAFIYNYRNSRGKSPTLEEIKDNFGFKSLTSVQRSIVSLEKHELIERNKYSHRSIEPIMQTLMAQIPLVGNVACGTPILAQENFEGYIPTDKSLLKHNEKDYFYLKAQGNSMDQVGINDGDLLLVHIQQTADNGQKVVALIDDAATVKILQKTSDFIKLMPKSSNPEHKPIILKQDFRIQGVVEANMSV